jgi:hypothetical protein
MMYNTQNYWAFRLCPSSVILKTCINFYLPFYPSSTNVRAFSQFLLHTFLISSFELAWPQVSS